MGVTSHLYVLRVTIIENKIIKATMEAIRFYGEVFSSESFEIVPKGFETFADGAVAFESSRIKSRFDYPLTMRVKKEGSGWLIEESISVHKNPAMLVLLIPGEFRISCPDIDRPISRKELDDKKAIIWRFSGKMMIRCHIERD
jgi:hypothetical protein